MNFAYLARKYFPDCQIIVEDRTYDGMRWIGPGEKPKEEIFKSLQDEEDRLARLAGQPILDRESQMQEKQRQARAQAEADLIPFQQKLGEYFEGERLKFLKLAQDALETKMALSLKEHAMTAWREITVAQDEQNRQAQEYLDATKHFLAWDTHKIPAEVIAKREEAHKLLSEGQLVYADWVNLRRSEMPTREEMQEALRKGGEHLTRLKKRCKEVSLRYPKPKRQHF